MHYPPIVQATPVNRGHQDNLELRGHPVTSDNVKTVCINTVRIRKLQAKNVSCKELKLLQTMPVYIFCKNVYYGRWENNNN